MKYEVELERNGFAIKGTMDMVSTGKIDLDEAENIVNMWIELTARKFYAEGVMDGLRRNKKTHQALCDMLPESDESVSVSVVNTNGVEILVGNVWGGKTRLEKSVSDSKGI